MGILKDVIDTVGGIQGEFANFIAFSKKHHSLSKSSMEGVLNFPVLVSNTLSIEDASIVSKALERQFASFTLTVMSMNPYLSTMGSNANAATYVKQFHQNMDSRVDSTDLVNAVGSFLQEASDRFDVDYECLESTKQYILYKVFEGVNYHGINMANLKFNYTISDVTNPKILNEFGKRRLNSYTPVKEDTYNDRARHVEYHGDHRQEIDRQEINVDARNLDTGRLGRELGRALNRGNGNGSGGGGGRRDPYGKNLGLMDNDVKKANELVPTLISMRIYPVDRISGDELPPIDFVVGVKATLHPITTEEMVVNIARGIKNENTFFNFVRWTTGEIRFFKDFLFSINEIKLDAMNSSVKASRWWSMLKRRRGLAKIKNAFPFSRILPNATIVITQEELDIIKNQYGYDLLNPSLAYKLMENYFLLAFVVVDPALQRVRFLFDGHNEYEEQTFASLARESSTNDKQFKEMINMLGRRI